MYTLEQDIAKLTAAQEKAQEVVEDFRLDFEEGHFWLACHAALPLAINPEMLYTIRANFLFDNLGYPLDMKWIAVADVLLHLCTETGNELYQMNPQVRGLLLKELRLNPRFQVQKMHKSRIDQLSYFLLAYVERHLYSSNESLRTFAEAQSWAALSYIQPEVAVEKIAQALGQAQSTNNQHEQLRLQLLLENIFQEQPELNRLKNFARANMLTLKNKPQAAEQLLEEHGGNVQAFSGVTLDIKTTTVPEETKTSIDPTVKEIQEGLVQLGFEHLSESGFMDEATQAAIQILLQEEEIAASSATSTPFILGEVIKPVLARGRKEKSEFMRIPVYIANSRRLRSQKRYAQFWGPFQDMIKQWEERGWIKVVSNPGNAEDPNQPEADAQDEQRTGAELVILPLTEGYTNHSTITENILPLYSNKHTSGQGIVLPILMEPISDPIEDFPFPKLPADEIPLSDRKDYKAQVAQILEGLNTFLYRMRTFRILKLQVDFREFLYTDIFQITTEATDVQEKPFSLFLSYDDRDNINNWVGDLQRLIAETFADNQLDVKVYDFSDDTTKIEEIDLCLSLLGPHHLTNKDLVDLFKTGKQSQENNTEYIPVLLQECLYEHTFYSGFGGLPKSGEALLVRDRIVRRTPAERLEEFMIELEAIILKVVEIKAIREETGEEPMGMWQPDKEFYTPRVHEADYEPPKALSLLLLYSDKDTAQKDQIKLIFEPLVQDGWIAPISDQPFGISKIDPEIEIGQAVERTDIAISLLSNHFFEDRYLPGAFDSLKFMVDRGYGRAYNIELGLIDSNDHPFKTFPNLSDSPLLDGVNTNRTIVQMAWVLMERIHADIAAQETQSQQQQQSPPQREPHILRAMSVQGLFDLAEKEQWDSIDLSSRNLEGVPLTFGRLPSLRSINLSSSNLKTLPKELFDLTNLQSLNLADNQLQDLPEEVSNWRSLQEINLSNNNLQRLPITFNLLEPLPKMVLFNNPLPIATKVIHDNPDDLFDIILENQDRAKNQSHDKRQKWQRTLLGKGYKLGPADGLLDRDFFEALYEFQMEHKLTPGRLDRETMALLEEIDTPEVSDPPDPSSPVKIFISYAHKDQELVNQMKRHLQALTRIGSIELLDHDFLPGSEWDQQIQENISVTDIILVMVSPDFLASDYTMQQELSFAFQRYREENIYIVPIILRACAWQKTKISEFQVLPDKGRPVKDHEDQDAVFYNITKRISQIVQTVQERKKQEPIDEAPAPSEKPFDSIRRLIANGDTKKAFQKATQLMDNKELIILYAKWQDVTQKSNIGAINADEASIEFNRINYNLLELLRELESDFKPGAPQAKKEERTPPNKEQANIHDELKSTIRQLVAKGQTKEALSQLLEVFPENMELLMTSSRWHQLQRKIVEENLSGERPNIETNKINYALLEIINDLSEAGTYERSKEQDAELGQLKSRAQQLIAKGQTEEALKILIDAQPGNPELMLTSSRWYNLQRKILEQNLEGEAPIVESNQINYALLQIIDELSETTTDEQAKEQDVELGQLKSQARQLIAKGQTEEALKILIDARPENTDLILNSSRWYNLQRKILEQNLEGEAPIIETNKINYALLQIIDDLE